MLKMKNSKKIKSRNRFTLILSFIFLFSTLIMTIGYSALSSNLMISGNARFSVISGIRITNVTHNRNEKGATEVTSPTFTKNAVTLNFRLPNQSSKIVYELEISNFTVNQTYFDRIEIITTDPNITCTSGMATRQLLHAETADTRNMITCSYNETGIVTQNDITFSARYYFKDNVSTLVAGANNTTVFGTTMITRDLVESIKFVRDVPVPTSGVLGSWQAGIVQNGSVMAWYTDLDNNNLYEVTVSGVDGVFANPSSVSLFRNYTNLESIDFNDAFSTANATNISYMFNGSPKIESLDMSNFDLGKNTTIASMFVGTTNLKHVNVSNWNLNNITNLNAFFSGNTSIVTFVARDMYLPVVTTMQTAFQSTTNLISLDVSGMYAPNVTALASFAKNAASLVDVNFSHVYTPSVTTYNELFRQCTSLVELDLSGLRMDSAIYVQSLFSGSPNIERLNLSGWNFGASASLSTLFKGLNKLHTLDLTGWNTTNVVDMTEMFAGTALTTLDLSHFDMTNVTSITNMFNNMNNIEELNLSGWNLANINSLHKFLQRPSLVRVNLSNWNLPLVTTIANMFQNNILMEEVDLSGWNTPLLESISGMFYGCTALTELDLKSINTSLVTNLDNAFRSTTLLDTVDISTWILDSVMSTNNTFLAMKIGANFKISDCSEAFLRSILPGSTNITVIQGTTCP